MVGGEAVVLKMDSLAAVVRRSPGSDELLRLLKDPFNSSFQQNSVWASLGTSIGFTVVIALAFSLLRPYNSVVYAPKLKHADEAHAPPAMGKGIFAWFKPVVTTKEQDLIRYMGLDATVFLRFSRMCRNIFLALTVLGCCILIPVNLRLGTKFKDTAAIAKLTPLNTSGEANWAQVVCAYAFTLTVAGFLWFNYRKVLQLRRQYYDSPEYLTSLHARTLMINDIPKTYRSDEGIGQLIDEVVPTSSFSRTAIARNVKDLPKLISEHEKTVRQLEKVLAKYLKNPDQLPSSRPTCKPSKEDPSYGSFPKGQKVDAIEYLTNRIRDLEMQIKDVRVSVDKRNAMSYGFASYEEIAEAHSIAYQCRKKHPQKTTIVLAPRANDVIWTNMPLTPATRRRKRIINNLWVALLTVLWIAPNAMISIFLVNLANLGHVWPSFQNSLAAHTTWWAIVQGVASPAVTSLIFLLLPILFRRMSERAGDRTKTARERHVTGKLYTFFVFNNLIVFSIFSVIWNFVAAVDSLVDQGTNAWDAIVKADLARSIFISICNISPFWITWLLQRNLGAAVDLAQLWTLLWSSCVKKFSSPTPRELIELTAPPAFDYASYYNYFLFYATVALALASIQPLVLPAAALYFSIDVYLKKYLLLYIFVTKTESGGMFWRVLFNRLIFAMILSNIIVFLITWVQGDARHFQAFCIIPLPFLVIAFKVYCARAFDNKIHYFTTTNIDKEAGTTMSTEGSGRKADRLAARYGHPALYKPLMTPMVHAKAQSILASIYKGRLSDPNHQGSDDFASVSGYSDTYALDTLKPKHPGKIRENIVPGFEMVEESHLDFTYFKDRAEFADEHGAGDIFKRPNDPFDRPGTADTFRNGRWTPGTSRAGSPAPPVPGIPSRHRTNMSYSDNTGVGTQYHAGYAPPPEARFDDGDVGMNPMFRKESYSSTRELIRGASPMPVSHQPHQGQHQSYRGIETSGGTPGSEFGNPMESRSGSVPPGLSRGPRGYGGLPQEDVELRMQDPESYEMYRATSKRSNAGWQGWT